ncbi:MAG: UvrD-helicase domain-containing protein, partial [Bacteroides sp.]|nr:UvrD-helicase domain-containing protein [Bacteroides sp.]
MLTIYKASAGSGKTYTLAYEYIKLLLGVRDPGSDTYRLGRARNPHARILAITFSNKATAEMKSRIIRELDALARGPRPDGSDADYAPRLV